MTKTEAREQMRRLRNNMSDMERNNMNEKIRHKLFELPLWEDKEFVFPFVSYRTEVDTIEIIKYFLEKTNIRVAVPKVSGQDMNFYEIKSLDDLAEGYQGILEPQSEKIIRNQDGVMLMPGLAFDMSRNRVGYGAGFYDRYISKSDANFYKIAVAYDFQIVDEIQANPHDIKADFIITDRRTI